MRGERLVWVARIHMVEVVAACVLGALLLLVTFLVVVTTAISPAPPPSLGQREVEQLPLQQRLQYEALREHDRGARSERDSALSNVFACGMLTLLAWFTAIGLFVRRRNTEFSCTDSRILIKSGLLLTRLREMPLAKVESLNMTQGFFGKIFGYGTLAFKGTGGTPWMCKRIEEPVVFYKCVQEQVLLAQKRK